jgi:hypothetical protein
MFLGAIWFMKNIRRSLGNPGLKFEAKQNEEGDAILMILRKKA